MPNNNSDHADDDQKRFEQYIAIWSKAVDTQMHFNEMSVKSRQLGLTFVASALGIGIVFLSRESAFALTFTINGRIIELHITVLLVLGAILALWAVSLLDLRVYHRMLRGAVTFGEDFEEQYMKKIFKLEKGMTQAVSHFSRFDDADSKTTDDGPRTYTGTLQMTAEKKIKKFYRCTMLSLLVAAVILFVVTNLAGQGSTLFSEFGSSVRLDCMQKKGTTN